MNIENIPPPIPAPSAERPSKQNISTQSKIFILICFAFILLIGVILDFSYLLTTKSPSETYVQIPFSTFLIQSLLLISCLVIILFLAFLFYKRICLPIKEIQTSLNTPLTSQSEVTSIKEHIQELLATVNETQEQLEVSHANLIQTEKMALVGKLAAGVAHSVRNPLTSVKLRLFALKREAEFTPEQHEDFDVIAKEISHLESIVSNFLEFSRRPYLKVEHMHLAPVVDQTIQLLQHRFDSNNITVIFEKDPLSPLLHIDPEQLKEAIINILINACDSMEHHKQGTITITENYGIVPPIGKSAILRVTDSGPGIPFNMRASIFQPFFTTKALGTGLGLTITQRIIEEHGGWLHLHSPLGTGPTFVIVLPISTEQVEPHNLTWRDNFSL